MGCNVRLTVLGHMSVHDYPRTSYHRMSTANGFGIRSNVEGREIRRQNGQRRRGDEVVMAVAWALNPARSSSSRSGRSNSANFFSLSLEDRMPFRDPTSR